MSQQIYLFRTHYPHWGKYSGIHKFISYVITDKFNINVQVVPMGSNNFPISNRIIQILIKFCARINGVKQYNLNDLVAEISGFRHWRRSNIDIFHYLDGEHSLQYLPLLINRLGFRKVKPLFVANFHQLPEKLNSFLNINIVRQLDHVIVLAPEQVSYFEKYLPKKKISLIPHGVDTDYFHPTTESKDNQKFKCLTVGSWLRDYDTVLAVAKRLKPYREIEFHIVSSNVQVSSKYENVYVYKGIDDDALLKLYQESNVLFLPLLSATANNALLEGIACGLPVVSTELSSVRMYVPGKEAILIERNNQELFVETLLHLYEHPEAQNEMAHFARKRAMELSWPNIAKQYEALYSGLAN